MKKDPIFTGAAVAIITPMHEDGSVNYDEFARFVDWQIDNGTDAIVICGTTGESSTLDVDEHLECIKWCIEYVNGRVPVIAGTGSNSTASAIEMSKEACEYGADALLLVTPYYNKTSQAGLIAHYTAIHDATDKPIVLYNVPSRTGLNLLPETALELSKLPRINGIKEASGNLDQVAKVHELCGNALNIWSGNDDQIVDILERGGKGVISVLSNVCPQETHDIVAKYLDGDVDGSKAQLMAEKNPQIKILFVGAERGLEKDLIPKAGYEFRTVHISSFHRSLKPAEIKHNLVSLYNMVRSPAEARSILKEFRPDAVIGTGGYASYPTVKAAAKMGIPTAVHESNAVPGLTTELLEPYAGRIMVGFESCRQHYKHPEKVAVTGTPVREDFFTLTKEAAKEKLGVNDGRPLIVSFWGSLGASGMNAQMADMLALEAGKEPSGYKGHPPPANSGTTPPPRPFPAPWRYTCGRLWRSRSWLRTGRRAGWPGNHS